MSDGKRSVSYCHQSPSLVKIQHCILLIKNLLGQKRLMYSYLYTHLHTPTLSFFTTDTHTHANHGPALLHYLPNNYFSLLCLIRNKPHKLKWIKWCRGRLMCGLCSQWIQPVFRVNMIGDLKKSWLLSEDLYSKLEDRQRARRRMFSARGREVSRFIVLHMASGCLFKI